MCSQVAPGPQETRHRKWPCLPAYHSKHTYQVKSLRSKAGGGEGPWRQARASLLEFCPQDYTPQPPDRGRGRDMLHNSWANPLS